MAEDRSSISSSDSEGIVGHLSCDSSLVEEEICEENENIFDTWWSEPYISSESLAPAELLKQFLHNKQRTNLPTGWIWKLMNG